MNGPMGFVVLAIVVAAPFLWVRKMTDVRATPSPKRRKAIRIIRMTGFKRNS